MGLESSNQVETNRYQLEVEVNAGIFERAVNQAFHKQGKKIAIPGFRKGKAPRAFVERYYGERFFYEDAAGIVYLVTLDKAMKAAQLRLADGKIDFDVVSIGKDGPVFKTIVTIWPEVSISDYRGLKASKIPVEITDEGIDRRIQKVQERNPRMITVGDRPTQLGDAAVIDLEGLMDGITFEGGRTEDHTLDLGSGRFISDLEEQVVGHSTDEGFDITVTFPEDYWASTLRSKEAVLKVKLHEIKQRELPAANDDFTKDVSEFNTLETCKEDIRKNLLESREKVVQDEVGAQLVNQLIEKLQGEIPEALHQNKINDDLRDFAYHLQSQSLDFNTYLKYTGMDQNTIHGHFKPQAEKQVKVRLALEKIAELKEIKTTAEEIEVRFEESAKTYGMEVDKVKSLIPEKDLAQDLVVEKAVGTVRDSAKITKKKG